MESQGRQDLFYAKHSGMGLHITASSLSPNSMSVECQKRGDRRKAVFVLGKGKGKGKGIGIDIGKAKARSKSQESIRHTKKSCRVDNRGGRRKEGRT